jgi:hypothetical protein
MTPLSHPVLGPPSGERINHDQQHTSVWLLLALTLLQQALCDHQALPINTCY